jgi:hypothetical protein
VRLFLLGFLLGFGAAWALFEWVWRRWRKRVLARTNEALDAAETRLEKGRPLRPHPCEEGHDPVRSKYATFCRRCGLVLELDV